MDRSYYIGSELVKLEEIEGSLSVYPSRNFIAQRSMHNAALRFGEQSNPVAEYGLIEEEYKAFESAGWLFVRPSVDVSNVFRALSKVPEAEAIGYMYRTQDGRLLVGTNSLIIKASPSYETREARAFLRRQGFILRKQLNFATNTFIAVSQHRENTFDAIERLCQIGGVITVEPRFLEAIGPRHMPSEPLFGQKWQRLHPGHYDVVESLKRAWNTTRGDGVKLAIVDVGFDVGHPDLVGGIIRKAYFKDDGTGDASLVVQSDDYPNDNHGTFCAGLAVARYSNRTGRCGVAPAAGLIPITCLNDLIGTQDTLARAIAYAAAPSIEDPSASSDDGADVISCSLGPRPASWKMHTVLQDAITFAANSGRSGKGAVIFWAVNNNRFMIQYDEVCSHPDVIAVGRSDRFDLENGSAYGPELDFLAPGVDVYSTTSGGGVWHGYRHKLRNGYCRRCGCIGSRASPSS